MNGDEFKLIDKKLDRLNDKVGVLQSDVAVLKNVHTYCVDGEKLDEMENSVSTLLADSKWFKWAIRGLLVTSAGLGTAAAVGGLII